MSEHRGYAGTRETPCFLHENGVCRTTEEGERLMGRGESDGLIVPKKAGNAAGGKEATHGIAV